MGREEPWEAFRPSPLLGVGPCGLGRAGRVPPVLPSSSEGGRARAAARGAQRLLRSRERLHLHGGPAATAPRCPFSPDRLDLVQNESVTAAQGPEGGGELACVAPAGPVFSGKILQESGESTVSAMCIKNASFKKLSLSLASEGEEIKENHPFRSKVLPPGVMSGLSGARRQARDARFQLLSRVFTCGSQGHMQAHTPSCADFAGPGTLQWDLTCSNSESKGLLGPSVSVVRVTAGQVGEGHSSWETIGLRSRSF